MKTEVWPVEDRTVESQVHVTLSSAQSQHLSVLRGLGAAMLRVYPTSVCNQRLSHKSCVDQLFLKVKIPVLGMMLLNVTLEKFGSWLCRCGNFCYIMSKILLRSVENGLCPWVYSSTQSLFVAIFKLIAVLVIMLMSLLVMLLGKRGQQPWKALLRGTSRDTVGRVTEWRLGLMLIVSNTGHQNYYLWLCFWKGHIRTDSLVLGALQVLGWEC